MKMWPYLMTYKTHFFPPPSLSNIRILWSYNKCRYGCKGYTSVVLIREGEDASLCPSVNCVLIIYSITVSVQYVKNCLVFCTSRDISSSPAGFLFLIFLSTESSSSCANCLSLMSNYLLIICVIGSRVTFGGFLSKCCFHSCIRFSWLVAFSLAFTVLFLLLSLFTICYAILDYLSSTESLILLIWFCMYSVCLFRYMLTNSFCAFLSFRALILVVFFLLHLEAVFSSACFILTAMSLIGL